jgi:small subunit ribosomal protein S6
MSLYECVIIARQEISAQQVEALAESFEKVITDNGGTIANRENWGLRSLAYKIKKNRKGNYFLLNIDAPADAVHEMERLLRLNEDILRHMTIRVDEFEEGPSILAQNHSRTERSTQSYNEQKSENTVVLDKEKEPTNTNIKIPTEQLEEVAKDSDENIKTPTEQIEVVVKDGENK